mgnify:FL=1
MLVYGSSLDNQDRNLKKFANQWFGPYQIVQVNDNPTYHLAELDGTMLLVPFSNKDLQKKKVI